ncbi:MAG: hypothetical protein PHN56_04850 [Candidatus Nanoarchaeia archaeon]|nr:hypothetical protein [Candidatus Nanoarchaeia archaeon]
MTDFKNMIIVKIVVAVIIFAVLMSIKSVFFMNIENYGLNPFEQNQLMETWTNFKGDYLFIIISIALSLIIGLKFNIKMV